MKVYYREGDAAFYGDLTYITDACEVPILSFDTKSYGTVRTRITLKNPVIMAVGMSRIHVRGEDGNDYAFYTEKPDWVQMIPRVADWCLVNERGVDDGGESVALMKNVLSSLTSDKKEV